MAAGLTDALFWGSLAFALVVAGVVAYPVNRWLIIADAATPCSTGNTDGRLKGPCKGAVARRQAEGTADR